MKKFLVLSFVALVGCASVVIDTPAQRVFAATQAYNAALSVAVAYRNLPPCTAPVKQVVCADKGVVATIQKADIVAFEALKSAQTVVRATGQTESSLQAAVRWATEAIGAFSRITATLSVK